jgi:predicted RNA-binding Zn ribbon-like protein
MLPSGVSITIEPMRNQKKPDAVRFQLVAGHPALDLVNTLDWRFRPSGSGELLNDYVDLLRFMEQSELMKPSEVQKLTAGDAVGKRRTLFSTKKLRECLASILYAIVDGQAPPIESLITLSSFARTLRKSEELAWCDSRLQWKAGADRVSPSDIPLRRLVSAALALLTSAEIDQLRVCSNQECRWLFLDGTKNKGRRWCDMKLCGNRIKAKRYRRRQHAAQ